MSYLSNKWNKAVVYIEMRFGNETLSCGSAFFYRAVQESYLVTNWHNFAGRDSTSGVPLSKTGGVPDHVRIHSYRVADRQANGMLSVAQVLVDIPLYGSFPADARWLQHPMDRAVDVAAIKVTEYVVGLHMAHVNDLESDVAAQTTASQDVFIIGFPIGLIPDAPFPVWKRGSIASDPTYDPHGLPKIYVDSATRKGMSGSVVVAKHIIIGPYKLRDGTEKKSVYSVHEDVIGVYSGRLHPHSVEAQLGIVWKRRAIDETILTGMPPAE